MLMLKLLPITLKMELTERNGIGPVAIFIASLGKFYQFAAPLNDIKPAFIDHILDVQPTSVQLLAEKK